MSGMTHELLVALAAFAFVTSVTPGPNNLMLMASGANFGFDRTIPHMLGVGLGFTFMVAVVGIGLMEVFEAVPGSLSALRVVSVLYLFYLAWKIANAAPPDAAGPAGRPMTFMQAALFQWANPKAWAMALSAISLYAPSRDLGAVLLVAAVFGAINLPSVSCWTLMGRAIRGWLTGPGRLRIFNRTMAVLLVASLWPMLKHLA